MKRGKVFQKWGYQRKSSWAKVQVGIAYHLQERREREEVQQSPEGEGRVIA